MHEAIFTRGNVASCSEEIRLSIHTEENVALYCPFCAGAENTKLGRSKSIRSIAFYVGAENIFAWLETYRGQISDALINEKIAIVKEALQ
jgi:hypothetical protein